MSRLPKVWINVPEARQTLGLRCNNNGKNYDAAVLRGLPYRVPPPRGPQSGIQGRRPRLYRRVDVELAKLIKDTANISAPAAVAVAAALVNGRLKLSTRESERRSA
jgi:hypothetical protein